MEHGKRIESIKEELVEKDREVFLALGGYDCFYLSGFYTESQYNYPVTVIPQEGEPYLLLSDLDRSAADDSSIPVRVPDKNFVEALIGSLEGEKVLLGGSVTVDLYSRLDEELDIEVDDEILRDMREVKSREETERIEDTCRLTENAIESFKDDISGETEREAAAQLEYNMRVNGSDGTAFPTIVASGASSATPHHPTGDRNLDGPVLVDVGARKDGYVSDISRTFYIGEPRDKYRKIYNAVLEAQRAAVKEVRDGVESTEVDGAARSVLEEKDLEEHFVHSTGHGVGISVHEAPNVSEESDETLEEGMVITVEPGVYLDGEFGVRIEDTYMVKKNGAERLTSLSCELEDNIIEV
ncbi:MAG: Xaa-Pro peptidase family protein [Candidatus Nanohaloarchaeota archaeon QJJ-7]|nr:Xaa-Pro peptidase family protein [Candidatus Nanohaloarchaeota archaeon QJJ-7]